MSGAGRGPGWKGRMSRTAAPSTPVTSRPRAERTNPGCRQFAVMASTRASGARRLMSSPAISRHQLHNAESIHAPRRSMQWVPYALRSPRRTPAGRKRHSERMPGPSERSLGLAAASACTRVGALRRVHRSSDWADHSLSEGGGPSFLARREKMSNRPTSAGSSSTNCARTRMRTRSSRLEKVIG
jgi:hypothetical protein